MALPSFTTERLRLRPRTLADTEPCFAMDLEPDVLRYIDGPWEDAAAHRAFIEDRTRGPYPEGLGYWTILRREDEAFLGWVLLIPLDAKGPEIEIGWRLRPAAWGHGYATEAARLLLRHGLVTLGLDEIIAETDAENRASRRVAEKLGLVLTSTRRTTTRRWALYRITRSAAP
jgi:RimJ/RimL family protein N-acetyltransferase